MKLKNSNYINFVVLSDLHLGHRRNSATEIIKNLNREFSEEKIAELDMIVFAGDLIDHLLTSLEIIEIDIWFMSFSKRCKRQDVTVFILEGTPSHDWKQAARFAQLNEKLAQYGAHLVYIKDLTIWYEEKFDMNFLFVPDEWSIRSEDTLAQVKELLRKKGIDQVDYAFLHGNFDYQIDSFMNIPRHDSEEYLKLVKHLLFIGHIHTRSSYKRIYAQGSFDRLGHNEEEPKGYLKVRGYQDGHHEVEFIENTGAKKFITLDCIGLDLEKTYRKIEKETGELPHGSYVRIKAQSAHPVFSNMDEILRKYPHCVWSKHPINEANEKENQKYLFSLTEKYTPVEINEKNIKSLLLERIQRKINDTALLVELTRHIDEMRGAVRFR